MKDDTYKVLYQVSGRSGAIRTNEVCSLTALKKEEVIEALDLCFENPDVTVCFLKRKGIGSSTYFYVDVITRNTFRILNLNDIE